MPYFHSTTTLSGGADVDYIFGTSTNPNNTIFGQNGSDLILADIAAVVPEVLGNTTLATAHDIDLASYWTISANPLIDPANVSADVSHTLVYGGDENGAEYYSFTANGNVVITADIDWATFDTRIDILDSSGTVVATNDNSALSVGGLGSKATTDSFVSYTTQNSGTYYIRVYNANFPQEFRVDGQFVMNISVGKHAATATLVSGDDVINAGGGDDLVFGGAGNDTIYGNTGDDTIYGGTGDDILNGGAPGVQTTQSGTDEIYGEAGDDTILYRADQFYVGEVDIVDGGSGTDELIINALLDTVGKYTVDLISGIVRGGSLTGTGSNYMTLTSIENVKVSGSIDIVGDNGNNQLTGDIVSGANVLEGRGGDDILRGGGGDDTLNGGIGLDEMYGEDGDDTLIIAAGDVNYQAEVIDGGNGNDTLYLDGVNFHVFGLGNSTLVGIEIIDFEDGVMNQSVFLDISGAQAAGMANLAVDGNDSVDSYEQITINMTAITTLSLAGWTFANWGGQNDQVRISGTSGNDIITGSSVADLISGRAGDDTLNGGDGDDILIGGLGADSITGGLGVDTISFVSAAAGVTLSLQSGGGTAGSGTGGEAAGDTYVSIENVTGSQHDDDIVGNSAANTLRGNSGDDVLNGAFGDDILSGGSGNDELLGGADNDALYGDNGDDILDGGVGGDILDGGAGIDTARYSGSSAFVNVNLATGVASNGDATGDTLTSIENLIGSSQNDLLTGNSVANIINGAAGDDTLSGDGGDDTLIGGAGADILDGGAGNDSVSGGDGNDELRFTAAGVYHETLISGGNGFDTLRLFGAIGTLDFTNQNTVFESIESVEFAQGQSGVTTHVIFSASAFNSGTGFAPNLVIKGGVGANDSFEVMLDTETSLDASGWTFTNWNTGAVDQVILTGDADNETIIGSVQNDLINGGAGDDSLEGGLGDDTILGGAGDDFVHGGTGDDILKGNFGNDELWGGSGADHLLGGDGDDALYGEDGDDLINSGAGNDTVDGGNGSDRMFGLAGDDILNGGDGDDQLFGGDGNDTLVGGAGADFLNGGAGTDTVSYLLAVSAIALNLNFGGTLGDATGDNYISIEQVFGSNFNDTIIGSSSDDVLHGEGGDDTVLGGAGDDFVYGGIGNDVLKGNTGNDEIWGGAGADHILGGDGDDIMYGEDGDDLINSGIGNDTVDGGNGDDRLFGLDGNDTLIGGIGDDILTGGNGNDILFGGAGADVLNGGAGTDTTSYALATTAVTLSLTTGGTAGDATGDSYISIERVLGSNYDDIILGSSATDRLYGRTGADTLSGGAGNDFLYGNLGDDVLNGNTGNDQIWGGSGADHILGGDGDDIMHGEDGDDLFNGGAGNDTMYGGNGNDRLFGLDGDDILDGGTNDDTLTGGTGADTFRFVSSHGADIIQDFAQGTDIIEFVGGPADFAALTITQVGSHVDISSASGTIRVLNSNQADFDASDFIFTTPAEIPDVGKAVVAESVAVATDMPTIVDDDSFQFVEKQVVSDNVMGVTTDFGDYVIDQDIMVAFLAQVQVQHDAYQIDAHPLDLGQPAEIGTDNDHAYFIEFFNFL